MSDKDINKMSGRELRSELSDMRWINETQAYKIRTLLKEIKVAQDAIETYRAGFKTDRLVNKTQTAIIQTIEKAAKCHHENMTSDEFIGVSVYHCSDCNYSWSEET